MKRTLITATLFVLALTAFTQNSFLMGVDTLKGVDTAFFSTGAMGKNTFLSAIQADIEYISDLSSLDSIHGETSINGIKYARLTPVNYNIFGFPGTKGGLDGLETILIDIVAIPNPYFGFTAYGVAGDTTIIKAYGLERK